MIEKKGDKFTDHKYKVRAPEPQWATAAGWSRPQGLGGPPELQWAAAVGQLSRTSRAGLPAEGVAGLGPPQKVPPKLTNYRVRTEMSEPTTQGLTCN